jgi:hypothetical protein
MVGFALLRDLNAASPPNRKNGTSGAQVAQEREPYRPPLLSPSSSILAPLSFFTECPEK